MAKGFTFKQFHVNDHECGMPVSTDGVILGAWATLDPQGPIVDIGTGSGLLALMAAQRTACDQATITAIEIDPSAAMAARHNFMDTPWTHRLNVIEQDIASWAASQPKGLINSIICNPPYFNHGEQAGCSARATARHTDTLSHHTLLAAISHLLSPAGVANLILPTYEGHQLIDAAANHQLFCHRVCEISTTETKPISRLLIALAHSDKTTTTESLVIHQKGGYSAAFTDLTRDFYLKM
ncbi:tRNA1(Val) (adenine(37)-N6)-methyltransferase [Photobacterium nomapromontoriensis]|uniref:tRNA1(Val) (adenine(37)-N6)-methyltransferase n=1 Tax=Photobacterium nomapromontoriensis TaxID=2910237 RepID=UPI003D105C32